jgi:hypothetical protein
MSAQLTSSFTTPFFWEYFHWFLGYFTLPGRTVLGFKDTVEFYPFVFLSKLLGFTPTLTPYFSKLLGTWNKSWKDYSRQVQSLSSTEFNYAPYPSVQVIYLDRVAEHPLTSSQTKYFTQEDAVLALSKTETRGCYAVAIYDIQHDEVLRVSIRSPKLLSKLYNRDYVVIPCKDLDAALRLADSVPFSLASVMVVKNGAEIPRF